MCTFCEKHAPRKPIVRYATLHNVVIIGEPAVIVPVDHVDKSLQGGKVFTSRVTQVIPIVGDSRPMFETENTIYVPVNLLPVL